MAGVLKVDTLNADSNLALKIANTAVGYIDSTGLKIVGSNLTLGSAVIPSSQFNANGTINAVGIASVNANTITTGTISTSQLPRIPVLNLPAGSVLQVVNAQATTQITFSDADVTHYNFQCAITPLYSTSKILAIATVSGIDNGGSSGRMSTMLYYDGTCGGTSGTQIASTQVGQPSGATGTGGMLTTTMTALTSAIGTTSTQYFKIGNSKNDGGVTWYVQRYGGTTSSITLMEIAQ